MKWIFGAFLSTSLLLAACAHDEFSDDSTTTQSTAAPVPGEKTGDSAISPQAGPGGAGANVHF